MKVARHKRSHIGKSMETESALVIAKGWGNGSIEENIPELDSGDDCIPL